ncbi:MAG TPA: DNA recombination protein RmuC, partial [Puia sp.]|nr:DNA recombination protein RmuC [Puia sp.]
MNMVSVIFLIISAAAIGAVVSWWVTKSNGQIKWNALQANHEKEIIRLENQKDFFENAASTMKETFGSLAANALRQNNEAFVTLAESRLSEKVTEAKGMLEIEKKEIDGIVKPLSESLGKMENKINELENKRENAYGRINNVLEGMQRATELLGKGTQNLIGALKNSGTRGKYGEIGLRRVVEFAGMIEHCDFIEQVSVSSDEGVLRPDMIIRLPESKTIVVDSKTPLDAYMKVFETENEAEQKLLLAHHARAVKDHLNKLGGKAYWNQFTDSPDYVIFYMQIESSFGAALQSDPELIEEAIRKNVIFATPTTLITLLRTVAFVWQQRTVAANIEQIRDAGIELYERTTVLLRHFSSMGGSLKSAVGHYNSAVTSLESRFMPQAKKLYTL